MEESLKVYKKGTDVYVNDSKIELFEVGGYFGIHISENVIIEIQEGFKEITIVKDKYVKIKR